jgi:O-antigen ligase
LSVPLLLVYFNVRSETFFMRFNMMEAAVLGYAQHPFLGVGLNNGTASMKETRQELRDMGIPVAPVESADSYYLAVLTEVGPLGFILFFGFFAQIVMIALRAVKEVSADMKPLLVGMVAGLASLATQSLGDGPLAGHAIGGTLWLFAAMIIVIRRHSPAETRLAVAGGEARAKPVRVGR